MSTRGFCSSSGIDGSRRSHYHEGQVLSDLECRECKGSGVREGHVTLDQVAQVLMPLLVEEVVRQLPEIIARGQLEVLKLVMES